MSRARRICAVVLCATLAAGADGAARAPAREPRPLRVTIAFTGDVSGYLEPCG
jgi:hypothetical protein